MAFHLRPLPYARDALGTFMSGETLDFHHGRHHRAYVDKVNALLPDQLAQASLVEIVRAARRENDSPLFNNAAQAWNHDFFWQCLAPAAGQAPTGRLAGLIRQAFGSVDGLLAALAEEAARHFSNGWAWLVLERGVLRILSLHDADTPIVREGMAPLLALDVWEHAYYLDYRNARAAFAEKVLGNIVNWDFVAKNLDGLGETRADQRPAGR
jgi:Fe-Mn family superoxide dismutase